MPPWMEKTLGLWGLGGLSRDLGADGAEEPRADAGEAVAVRCGACNVAEAPLPAIALIVLLGKGWRCGPWIANGQRTDRVLTCNGTHGECAR